MSIQSIISLLWRSKLLLSLVILFLAGALISPIDSDGNRIFVDSANLLNILRQVSITGILAVGMTLVILTGGIDLAVGSIMAFGATLCAMLLTLEESHHGIWVGGASFGLLTALLLFAFIQAGLALTNANKNKSVKNKAELTPAKIFLMLICVLASVSASVYFFQNQLNALAIPIIIIAVMAATAILGAVSGSLVAKGGLQAFIATLAMMVAALGLARLMAGQDRSVFPIYGGINVRDSFALLREPVFGIPMPGIIFLLVVGVFSLLLSRFRFGRYIYAIGGNETAAYLSGIPVAKVKIWVYTLCGALSGLAGVLYCAQYQQGKPDAGTGMELDAIAAVVIGGANLMGGRGTVNGTLIGVFIFGVLSNILQLNNVDSNTQLVLKGLIIVIAVLVQQAQWHKLLSPFSRK